jgi:hypothetical protein
MDRAGVSVEQQPQPDAVDANGSWVRVSVPHMSVPFSKKRVMGAGVERL